MHIAPFEQGNIFNKDPLRDRKILLHKSEIRKLNKEAQEKGITIIPLNIHLSNNKAKLTLGLCKGKKLYDKRECIKRRDIDRKLARQDFS